MRAAVQKSSETLSSCIPPFAAVTLTLEDGAFSTAWRRAMTTGFLSLSYLTFIPVVFFPGGDPVMPKSPKTISM
jgi:hypothetical protein